VHKLYKKCTLVQALRLCTGHTAHRGSRGIALLFLDHGTRRGWGVSVTPRPLFTPGKDRVPISQEAGRASGPVWTGAENLASAGIRSPDCPVRSQLLYRLSYPAHYKLYRPIVIRSTDSTSSPCGESSRWINVDGRLEQDGPYQPVGAEEGKPMVRGRRHLLKQTSCTQTFNVLYKISADSLAVPSNNSLNKYISKSVHYFKAARVACVIN